MLRPQTSSRVIYVVAIFLFSSGTLSGENWPQWRGPAGDSVSQEKDLPLKWSEDRGILWKTKLPEWGTSTPAVWDDAIFLTTQKDGKLLLLRIDKANGSVVWRRQVGTGAAHRKVPGGGKRTSKYHNLHNMASPSPVVDGQRVIVHFGNGDLASYTFDGTREWKRNLADDHGRYTIWWGHANSPVLHKDLVISVCMQDSLEGASETLAPSYLVAHQKRTGKMVWQRMRMTGADAEQCDSYTTPVFARRGSHTEMIVMGGNQLDAYDPLTGEPLWHLPGLVGGRTITGPTVGNGIVYATIGMHGPLHAVKLSGSGKLSASRSVSWKQTQNTPDTCCPVISNGLLFLVTDHGVASCVDVRSGQPKWKKRIAGGNHKASPIAADGKIYFLSRDGHCSVVKAAPRFELLAQNKLDDEFTASPAVSDGRIYLRGRKWLYALGESP